MRSAMKTKYMSNTNSNPGQDENSIPFVPRTGVLKQNGEDTSLDTIFVTLKSQRRRYIVYYLHQQGELTVDELAELIAASENGGGRPTVTDDEQDTVEISLIHTHLPQLDGAGIIEYDDTARRVRLEEDILHLRPHLEEAAKVELT